jgi:hypothetical protein
LGGEPDFGAGNGVEGVVGAGVDVAGVVPVVVVVEDVPVGAAAFEELGAAAAPAMPEMAPPAASEPATIVAPSSLDVFMRSNLLGSVDEMTPPSCALALNGPVGACKAFHRPLYGARKRPARGS